MNFSAYQIMSDRVKPQRITREQARRFAQWFFNEQDHELISKYSSNTIRKYFRIDTGILVSTKFIDEQFHRWIVINNQLYRIDQPWTHPKPIDL